MRDSKRDTDVLNSLLDSVGEGEGGVIWENGIETCIISYKKWIASLGSMQDTGCLGLVHWDDPEEWYGEGGGRGFRIGNTCTPVVDSCWFRAKPMQYCKVKNNNNKIKKQKRILDIFFETRSVLARTLSCLSKLCHLCVREVGMTKLI